MELERTVPGVIVFNDVLESFNIIDDHNHPYGGMTAKKPKRETDSKQRQNPRDKARGENQNNQK